MTPSRMGAMRGCVCAAGGSSFPEENSMRYPDAE